MNRCPRRFIERMRRLLGEGYDALGRALGEVPPVSLRLNSAKPTADGDAPAGEAVPWCPSGRYLATRPAFTFDPRLHAGAYYVQEAASMFLEQAVCRYVTSPVMALDLCAARGQVYASAQCAAAAACW